MNPHSNVALYESILRRYRERLRMKNLTKAEEKEYLEELDEAWDKLTPSERVPYEKAGVTKGHR